MIHDVVIAGAGPVGLFLACELRGASPDGTRQVVQKVPRTVERLPLATLE